MRCEVCCVVLDCGQVHGCTCAVAIECHANEFRNGEESASRSVRLLGNSREKKIIKFVSISSMFVGPAGGATAPAHRHVASTAVKVGTWKLVDGKTGRSGNRLN